ncbi:MAG: succinate dehydrogenase assembly factor 2 [Gammaproteobacteria bacterium]|nr:succinate dehydrogenase assembly factor 2 [Gammaproteobacteria bacterium]
MIKSRIKWQCRRGMRELDDLLMGYVEQRYDDAGDDEKAAFEALLALPDPDLVAYLLQKQQPDLAPIADVIRHVLRLNSA